MKVLNKNIKEKPVIATLLFATIIGLVCLNIFILRYYQAQTELPPKLIAVTEE